MSAPTGKNRSALVTGLDGSVAPTSAREYAEQLYCFVVAHATDEDRCLDFLETHLQFVYGIAWQRGQQNLNAPQDTVNQQPAAPRENDKSRALGLPCSRCGCYYSGTQEICPRCGNPQRTSPPRELPNRALLGSQSK